MSGGLFLGGSPLFVDLQEHQSLKDFPKTTWEYTLDKLLKVLLNEPTYMGMGKNRVIPQSA